MRSAVEQGLGGEPADSLQNARIFYDRGYIEQAQHQLPAAEADYRKAIGIDPKQFESHAALGHLLAQQQQWNDARHELETAVTLQPATGDPRQAGCRCCAHTGTRGCGNCTILQAPAMLYSQL